jgi:hypothetical protein
MKIGIKHSSQRLLFRKAFYIGGPKGSRAASCTESKAVQSKRQLPASKERSSLANLTWCALQRGIMRSPLKAIRHQQPHRQRRLLPQPQLLPRSPRVHPIVQALLGEVARWVELMKSGADVTSLITTLPVDAM